MRIGTTVMLGMCSIVTVACADTGPRDASPVVVTPAAKIGVTGEPGEKTAVPRPIVVDAPTPIGRPSPQ